jgi:hypothetical protein
VVGELIALQQVSNLAFVLSYLPQKVAQQQHGTDQDQYTKNSHEKMVHIILFDKFHVWPILKCLVATAYYNALANGVEVEQRPPDNGQLQ